MNAVLLTIGFYWFDYEIQKCLELTIFCMHHGKYKTSGYERNTLPVCRGKEFSGYRYFTK